MPFRAIAPLCLLAAFCLSLPAAATTPRALALGGAGDYFEDDEGHLRWYGALADYGNAVTVDLGHGDLDHGYHRPGGYDIKLSGPAFGLRQHLPGDSGVLALRWQTVASDPRLGTLQREELGDGFTVQYGRRLGTVQGTATFFHASDVYEDLDESRWHLGLGLRFDLSEGAYIDLAGEHRHVRAEVSYLGDLEGPDSMGESTRGLGLRGRLFYSLGERTALVPMVQFVTEKRPTITTLLVDGDIVEGHNLRLGCGLNFFPDTDRFFQVAAEYVDGKYDRRWRSDLEGGIPTYSPGTLLDWHAWRLQAGWENRFLPWLTLRSSVNYGLRQGEGLSGSATDVSDRVEQDDLLFSLGLGVQLPGWDLDVALTQQEPFRFGGDWGPHFDRDRTTFVAGSLRYTY